MSTGVARAGVVRSYRVDDQQTITALDGVDLEVTGGSVVALWGQSGSGKSTLLQFVGGLDRPDAGEIRVDGLAIGGLPPKHLAADRRGVGFVFHRYHRERAGELATLRATEWDERALGLLVALEGRGSAPPSDCSPPSCSRARCRSRSCSSRSGRRSAGAGLAAVAALAPAAWLRRASLIPLLAGE